MEKDDGEHAADPPEIEGEADEVVPWYRRSEDEDTPWYKRRDVIAATVATLVVLTVGYVIGYARGSAGLEQGSSPTTSVVDGPPTASSSSTTGTTIDIATVEPPALPTVAISTEDFARSIPPTIAGMAVTTPSGAWEAFDGAAGPAPARPLPVDATDARLAGEGPELFVTLEAPPQVVAVTLTQPTAFSGLVFRATDAANYWAIVPDAGLANLTIYQVKDGQQRAAGFVEQDITPGLSIGLIDVAGQIGAVVNGSPVPIRTFYGPVASLPDNDIAGTSVGLLTGAGDPRFDDLTFG